MRLRFPPLFDDLVYPIDDTCKWPGQPQVQLSQNVGENHKNKVMLGRDAVAMAAKTAARTSKGFLVPLGARLADDGGIYVGRLLLGTDAAVEERRTGRQVAPRSRYGRILYQVRYADRMESDHDDEKSAADCRSCARMRALIRATERLREHEDASRRATSRPDVEAAEKADGQAHRARIVVSKMWEVSDRSTRHAEAELARAWQRGTYAMTRAELADRGAALPAGPTAHSSPRVVRVYPAWYVPASKVRRVGDVMRVIRYVRSHHDVSWFDRAQSRAVPSSAVPPCHMCEEAALLQNLPAGQHARVALLAAWIRNIHPLAREISAACRSLQLSPRNEDALKRYGAYARSVKK